ncbi:MAG: AMP-binding protein, partial [Deltaproteobacteria bacterium]|nr:AMP-binding protein [Deltaproteobacteria bacterium]
MIHEFQYEEKVVAEAVIRVFKHRPKSLWEMFSRTVANFPGRMALVSRERRISYEELNRRAASLCTLLKEDLHVGKGDRVALFLKNDDAFVVAFLALSRAGAVSVVLNTQLKRPALEDQLKITKPVGGIVDEEIWDNGLDPMLGWKIQKDFLVEGYSSERRCDPIACDEEDLHTILFTSGTTGMPKGAMILHRNLIHSAMRMDHYMGKLGIDVRTEGGRTLVAAPLFHVMALQEQLLPSLWMGGTSVLMEHFRVGPFTELILRERIDQLVAPPAVYRILLSREEFKSLNLGNVKLVGFGGAPMPPDMLREMKGVFQNAKLINGFGLTEASVSAIAIDEECIQRPTSIGRASAGSEVRIVSQEMKDMPYGEVGEIAVRGPHVVAGYFDDPEETADKFRSGWFLTGDLGTMDKDGFIFVSGRKKEMIIRGGENVYPVSVENVLCLHPKILEVAVCGVPDEVMGEKVVACIVPLPGTCLTEDEVLKFCSGKLAKYQIPEYIKFVSA